jgi:hypothetical protein
MSGTRIYFDPVRIENTTDPSGPVGVRCSIFTPDGKVEHVMTLTGAHRRADDFRDAIYAATQGHFVDDSLTAEDILGEATPSGRLFSQ